MNPYDELNPAYVHILTEVYGKGSLEELLPNGSLSSYADRALSSKFSELQLVKQNNADTLRELREQHTNEILELKLKLSNLIDTNYNLMQLLNKDNHVKD